MDQSECRIRVATNGRNERFCNHILVMNSSAAILQQIEMNVCFFFFQLFLQLLLPPLLQLLLLINLLLMLLAIGWRWGLLEMCKTTYRGSCPD
jgi:hypothetical protein